MLLMMMMMMMTVLKHESVGHCAFELSV